MADEQGSNVVKNCFFNANYNQGHPEGQSRYVWGVRELDLARPLQEQILDPEKVGAVYNFNLTALNEVGIVPNLSGTEKPEFIVIAGKYDDQEMNCKYSSEPHETLEAAIEDYDRVSSYPWAYIEFNGRILDVWPRGIPLLTKK